MPEKSFVPLNPSMTREERRQAIRNWLLDSGIMEAPQGWVRTAERWRLRPEEEQE